MDNTLKKNRVCEVTAEDITTEGAGIGRIDGAVEIGFVTRFETLAAETWWMNQEVRVITRKPNFYTPLTI